VSAQPKSRGPSGTILATNRKARHDYHILATWEVGLVLTGSEAKSLRLGRGSLKGAFAVIRDGEVWLEGMNIPPYESGAYANHIADRARKVLMHRREIRRLVGAVEQRGQTLVPLDVHLARGFAKVTLALAKGKKVHDKREALKRKDADREVARAMSPRR
jgi:SsrA-binding protein